MNKKPLKRNTLLIPRISQFEVDFVVPRIGTDIPVGIDPFLLYKSRDIQLSTLHRQIVDLFNSGFKLIHSGQRQKARSLFSFPEVSEIGFGYSREGKKGSGVGRYLSELIIETLAESPVLLKRGIRHVEEMQLISVGIGPDRISDIAANLIKAHLIEYTQKQCETWSIPLHEDVPLKNVFQADLQEWVDGYFKLPRSPFDGSPICSCRDELSYSTLDYTRISSDPNSNRFCRRKRFWGHEENKLRLNLIRRIRKKSFCSTR